MSPNPPSHSTSTHLQCVSVHTHSHTHRLCQTTNSNRKQKNKRRSYLNVLLIYIYIYIFLFKWWLLGWEPAVKVPFGCSCSNSSLKLGLRQRRAVQTLMVFPTWPQLPAPPTHTHTHHKAPSKPQIPLIILFHFFHLRWRKKKKKASQSTDQEPWWLFFLKYFKKLFYFDLKRTDSGRCNFLFLEVFLEEARDGLFLVRDVFTASDVYQQSLFHTWLSCCRLCLACL